MQKKKPCPSLFPFPPSHTTSSYTSSMKLKTLGANDRLWFLFLRTKGITRGSESEKRWVGEAEGRGGIGCSDGREGTRGRENRDSYCGERSTEAQSKCERGDEKQAERGGKVRHAFLRGRNCPMVPWPSVWQTYDQKMIKLHWHFSLVTCYV